MKPKLDTKKLVTGCALLILFVLICSVAMGNSPKQRLSDKYDEAMVLAEAERAIGYFNDRDYQSIVDMGEAVAETVTAEKYDAVLDELGDFLKFNKREAIGATDPETGEEYAGALVVATYQQKVVQFSIGFNENMELIQFLIQ